MRVGIFEGLTSNQKGSKFASSPTGTRDTTPVILTTGSAPLAIAVAAGIPGPPVNLAASGLTNTIRVPIEITEINFVVDDPFSPANVNYVGEIATGFELTLSIGRYLIMSQCPIVAVAPRTEAIDVEGSIVGGATSPIAVGEFRWILPRPLIVAPNESFNGVVRLSPNLAPYTRTTVGVLTATGHFSMTARGRRLPQGTPIPSRRTVPYASGWFFTVANRPAPDMTFQNPHDSIFHVRSINAHLAHLNSDFVSSPLAGNVNIDGPGGLSNAVKRSLASNQDMNGLFAQRNALEVSHDLEPREAYTISLSNPTSVAPSTALAVTGTAVGITGWREE